MVEEATVAKNVVEVELVVVELIPVKFCNVEEARERKPPVSVVRPETATVPVKLAAEEIFCPLIRPDVIVVAKRLVEEATVAKNVVEVELVVVLLTPVKFCNVEEARERKPP